MRLCWFWFCVDQHEYFHGVLYIRHSCFMNIFLCKITWVYDNESTQNALLNNPPFICYLDLATHQKYGMFNHEIRRIIKWNSFSRFPQIELVERVRLKPICKYCLECRVVSTMNLNVLGNDWCINILYKEYISTK